MDLSQTLFTEMSDMGEVFHKNSPCCRRESVSNESNPQHVFLSCSLLHPIILIKRQHAEKHDTSSSHSFLVGLTFPTVIFKPLRMATINHEKSKQHGYEPKAFSYHLYTYKNVAFFAFHDRALKLTISLFNDLQIRVKTALNCQKLVVSVRNVV